MNSTEHVSMQESSGKCYLPHGVVEALFTHSERPSLIFFVRQLTGTLVNEHSSMNPILYCWKITEVRQAVKNTIKTKCCLRK